MREFIKVKHKGFYFHDKYFQGMNQLIGWYKEHYNEPQYRKYAKRAKSPRAMDRIAKMDKEDSKQPITDDPWST